MFALISDIHSNLEALTAVLNDAKARGVDAIHCLGDIVGYGPDPGPCLDLVAENCDVVILGNHDYAVLYEPTRFNAGAEAAAFWTRARLEDADDEAVRLRWEFLGNRPILARIDGAPEGLGVAMFAHGSPRRPVNEYLFPDDVYTNPGKVMAAIERVEHVCFVGHTHVPGIFTESCEFVRPTEGNGPYTFEPGRSIANVGSVGQPRDRDPRASYAIVHDGAIEFIRVEYDLAQTVKKVLATDGLDDFLGKRLEEGR